MGVKGLKRYLSVKLEGVQGASVLPQGSTLCVDGDGWMFQLTESCVGFQPELGGCYGVLHDWITAEVQRLRECGLKILVFLDGKKRRMKARTTEERRRKREDQWLKFYDFCEEGVALSANDLLPLPALCMAQLKASLKACGVQYVQCDEEADQEIAKYVCASNADLVEERFFAYGRDSDYLLMRDCPYIEMGPAAVSQLAGTSGKKRRPNKNKKDADSSAQAQVTCVWQRAEICEALGVTADQLLTWAMLVGNDYTNHFKRRTHYCVAGALEGESEEQDKDLRPLEIDSRYTRSASVEALDYLLLMVIEWGPGASLVAAPSAAQVSEEDGEDEVAEVAEGDDAAAVQLALDFSRAVYELQPLDAFPLDGRGAGETKSQEAQGDAHHLGDCSALLNETREYAALVGAAEGGKKFSEAEHAIAYLRWQSEVEEREMGLTEAHLNALDGMLNCIYEAAEAKKGGAVVAPSVPGCRPKWEDVIAANVFQSTCRKLSSVLPDSILRGKYRSPQSLFDGLAFHRLVNEAFRVEQVEESPEGVDTLADVMRKMKLEEAPSTPTSKPSAFASPMSAPIGPSTPAGRVGTSSPTHPVHETLPIEAYREEILQRIRDNRVTIIHGETGCGKSSCLPRFLLEDAKARGSVAHCRIFVSQPRRIAVTALLRRLRQTLGTEVGMRMGHGIKDETPDTKISFVTTGYLVRLLAHHPESFKKCSHLIIDEVHERSVDGDLVCLLARDVLRMNPDIRVILMSATIHTELYRTYFMARDDGTFGSMECLSVGARRFPVNIMYAEDLLQVSSLASSDSGASSRIKAVAPAVQSAARDIVKMTEKSGGEKDAGDVPAKLALSQYKAVLNIVRAVAQEGTGVLVFVSGITDITELVLLFEPYDKYLVYPVHSEIPPDEQEMAFSVTPKDKVKVVVATNAAESSVTIPDVDVVICMGTHKALQYSESLHRTQLVNMWISKASATQRAGRTGRVRPGKVFRLYSKQLHERFSEHEVAEVHRRPLQDVLLGMWVMMEDTATFEGVLPIMQGLIEAPDMQNIQHSYQYLHENDLITAPSDEGFLTAIGRLSGELPVDIALGRLIAYGVILGVAAEAVVLAAALSLPRGPFRYANAIYHDPEEYNDIVRRKFLASVEFDAGTYSEPIMLLRLLQKWRTLGANKTGAWAFNRAILPSVMSQFKSMADNLARTVSTRLQQFKRGKQGLEATAPEGAEIDLSTMTPLTPKTVNLLRMILLWSSSGNVLRMAERGGNNSKRAVDTNVVVGSNEVTAEHITALLGGAGISYRFGQLGKRIYDARIRYWDAAQYFHSLLQLLEGMAAMAKGGGEEGGKPAECWWVTVKSVDERSTTVVMVIPRGPGLEGILCQLNEMVFNNFVQRFNANRGIYEQMATLASWSSSACCYVVRDASKSELKRLNDFRDRIDVSLSMFVPVVGNAKLTVSNCTSSEAQLQRVFYAEGAEAEDSSNIACQVTNHRTEISFPESESEETDLSPLLDDLPMGHRLLNCCLQRMGKGRGSFLVLKRAKEAESTYNLAGAVLGSARYAEEQASHGVGGASKDDGKMQVKLGTLNAGWANIRAIKTTPSESRASEEMFAERSMMAVLQKQSLVGCSMHLGAESVFAVAANTLIIGAQGDMVACEGVTFLPPGSTWLYLALTCAGADGAQVGPFANKDSPLLASKQQQTQAQRVAFLIGGATKIVPRDDIVQLLDAIFQQSDTPIGNRTNDAHAHSDGAADDDELDAMLAAAGGFSESEVPLIVQQAIVKSSGKKKKKNSFGGMKPVQLMKASPSK